MMLQNTQSKNTNGAGNSNSGQLLRDIEEISKALYLHKPPPKILISPSSDVRSKSAGKTRFSDLEPKSNSNPRFLREDLLYKGKKSSSLWNWKMPLKALSHIGNRKFNCFFYLHVHSVEGLPVNFNNLSVRVNWMRKDEVLQTSTSKVVDGVAEFDETLMYRCTVYGSRSGPNHSVKYEEKLCLIYASLSGVPGIDIGKHWVDLTRLLPLTLEELEGEKSYGKWTTSFNLSGKAKGANLNVSLGFLVMQDKLVNVSANPNVSELMNTAPRRSGSLDTGARVLRRVGSVPSNVNPRPAFSSQTLDLKVCREVLMTGGLEVSKSIDFLCQTLDEAKLSNAMGSDTEHAPPLKTKPDINHLSSKRLEENEEDDDEIEFTIVEVGTEMCEKEQFKSGQVSCHDTDDSAVEIIHVDEIINDYDIGINEKTMVSPKDVCDSYVKEVVVEDHKCEKDSVCTKSTMEEVESDFHFQLTSESADLVHLFAPGEFPEEINYLELKSTYKASRTSKRSLSLDDITESVSSDFLSILGMDHISSDSDADSPRERLLREFEKESRSGNLLFNFDWKEEVPEVGPSDIWGSEGGDCFENSDLSLSIQAAEEERKTASEILKRRKAKILEGLETEALMREWGLNEKSFQNSPRTFSGGFGSPIELSIQEPLLPPLEAGFGPYVWLKGGGFLQSMNPSLFRNAKNGGNLVIQISNPVVLPAEIGSDVMEIVEHLALVGDKLHEWVNKLIPLEDITGKTIQQVAWEAAPNTPASERFEQILYGWWQDEGFPSRWSCNNLRPDLGGSDFRSDYVPIEFLAPLAMEKIESLSLEGLRIQSHMSSNGEALSSIYPRSCGKMAPSEGDSAYDADELMALSLSLEEWLRLDAKIISDEDHNKEKILKILAAHHAKCRDLVGGRFTEDMGCSVLSGNECRLFGDSLTIALMVQLRDPFRNYEPVGVPMLALIQAERVLAHSMPKVSNVVLNDSNEKEYEGETNEEDDRGSPQFRVIEVHLAGVDTAAWGTTTQLQSGCRWLLGSGMGKTSSLPLSNSKAIVRSSSPVSGKQRRDFLWSISSDFHGTRPTWKDLTGPYIRNPNVILPVETIKPYVNM